MSCFAAPMSCYAINHARVVLLLSLIVLVPHRTLRLKSLSKYDAPAYHVVLSSLIIMFYGAVSLKVMLCFVSAN